MLNYLDSIYRDFSDKAAVRQRTGETSNLERLTAQNKHQEILLMKQEAQATLGVYQLTLQQLLNLEEPVALAVTPNGAAGLDGPDGPSSPPQAASRTAPSRAVVAEIREFWSIEVRAPV